MEKQNFLLEVIETSRESYKRIRQIEEDTRQNLNNKLYDIVKQSIIYEAKNGHNNAVINLKYFCVGLNIRLILTQEEIKPVYDQLQNEGFILMLDDDKLSISWVI